MKLIATLAAAMLVCTSANAQWKYRTLTDTMRGTKTQLAEIRSTNRAQLNFPYAGGSSLELTIRSGGSSTEQDAFLWVNRGQLPCITGCSVSVKFDNDDVTTWQGSGPASHRTDTIFIDNATGFIERLKNSKRLTIEVTLYAYGDFQFTFNTAGLKWQ